MHNPAFSLLTTLRKSAATIMDPGSFMPMEPLPNSVKAKQLEQQEELEAQQEEMMGSQENQAGELESYKSQVQDLQGQLQQVQMQAQQAQATESMAAQQKLHMAQLDAQQKIQEAKLKAQADLLKMQEKYMSQGPAPAKAPHGMVASQLKRITSKVDKLTKMSEYSESKIMDIGAAPYTKVAVATPAVKPIDPTPKPVQPPYVVPPAPTDWQRTKQLIADPKKFVNDNYSKTTFRDLGDTYDGSYGKGDNSTGFTRAVHNIYNAPRVALDHVKNFGTNLAANVINAPTRGIEATGHAAQAAGSAIAAPVNYATNSIRNWFTARKSDEPAAQAKVDEQWNSDIGNMNKSLAGASSNMQSALGSLVPASMDMAGLASGPVGGLISSLLPGYLNDKGTPPPPANTNVATTPPIPSATTPNTYAGSNPNLTVLQRTGYMQPGLFGSPYHGAESQQGYGSPLLDMVRNYIMGNIMQPNYAGNMAARQQPFGYNQYAGGGSPDADINYQLQRSRSGFNAAGY